MQVPIVPAWKVEQDIFQKVQAKSAIDAKGTFNLYFPKQQSKKSVLKKNDALLINAMIGSRY